MNWTENFLISVERAHGAAYVDRICRESMDDLAAQRDLTLAKIRNVATASAHLTHIAKGEIDMIARFDIPAVDYHGWAMKFADKDGNPNYACWRNEEFLREYWRDNPELRCAEGKRMNRVFMPGKPDGYVSVPFPKSAIVPREPHTLETVARPPHKLELVAKQPAGVSKEEVAA